MSGSISSLSSLATYDASDLRSDSSTASDALSTTPATGGSGPPYSLNPALQVDPDLGLAILQFCDQSGDIEYTVPSSRQIAAYQAAMQSGTADKTDSKAESAPSPAAPS